MDDQSPRTKDLPLDTQDATYRQHKGAYDEIQRCHPEGDEVEVAACVILISGCQDNQLSLDGKRNGLFTQTLLKVWSEGQFKGCYRRFWKAIAKQMPSSQSPNYFKVGQRNIDFERQTPLTI